MSIRLFPDKTHFDFMGKRWVGFGFSIILTLLSLGILFTKGLNLGIDFTGGILMEIHTEKPLELASMREVLNHQGFGEISLQNTGNASDIMIRIQVSKDDEQSKVTAKVKDVLATQTTAENPIDYRKIDYVGPTVGQELIQAGVWAVLSSFAAIMLYVWFRFEWQFAVGAVIATLHDLVLTIGFFAVTQIEFNMTSIAAILTIVGYSLNDTVVVFDRIRELLRRYKTMPAAELLDLSINSTLSRTLMTSVATSLALVALVIYGGAVIKSFSWAMIFGVVIGTYSSIFIAAPVLIYLGVRNAGEAEQIDETDTSLTTPKS